MPLGKRQRKLLRIFCVGIGGLILLILSLPLWFPWVLRPVASRFGASFGVYERNGYGRITLHQFTLTNGAIRIRAERTDLVVPTVWLWRSFSRTSGDPLLEVNNWQLERIPSITHSTHAGSTYQAVRNTETALSRVEKWLPVAKLSRGAVFLPGIHLQFPSAIWSQGKLTVATTWPDIPAISNSPLARLMLTNQTGLIRSPMPQINVTANLVKSPYEVHLESEVLRLHSAWQISAGSSGVTASATGSWWSNKFTLNTQFAQEGTLPASATFQAEDLHLRGAWLRLPDYPDITGSILAKWQTGRFDLEVSARGLPLVGQTNLPPLKMAIHASGDTNSATIHSATVSSPWLKAELSEHATLYFRSNLLRQPAHLNLSLDLAKQPWLRLQGTLQGEAQLLPEAGKWPGAHFHLAGVGIGNDQAKAETVKVDGTFHWPSLEIALADGKFEDSSLVSLQGKINFAERNIHEAKLQYTGALLRRWFPKGYSCEKLAFTASASGPIKALHHTGRLEITNFIAPQFNPLQLHADWRGTQLNLDEASFLISIAGSSLSLDGKLAATGNAADLTLTTLTMARSGQTVLALSEPFHVFLEKTSGPTNPYLVRLDALKWQGSGGEIQVDGNVAWPSRGVLHGSAHHAQSVILNDFLKTKVEPIQIDDLALQAGWTNGPLIFALAGSASMRAPIPSSSTQREQDLPLSARVDLHGDAHGMVISNLVVNSQTSAVAVAHGFLPLTYHPAAATNRLRLEMQTPFHLTATTQPQSIFWEKIAAWSGLGLLAPDLRLDLSGTWQAPLGAVQLQASQIRFRKNPKIPPVDHLQFSLKLDREKARIEECRFLVQEQPVLLTGELPLGERLWSGETRAPDWSKAEGHLLIERAQLAAFSPLFPELLAPQGELSIDVSMKPGAIFTGHLIVNQARTRPLPSVGPIRDIEVKMVFRERVVRVESATAQIGGAAVLAEGEADLQKLDWRKPAIPPFKFLLRGTNVPLSRQPESIVRSDLDLTVTKTNDASPILAGTAHLRDSYYLHDLADLVPGKVTSPSRRPPYFSIEAEPLAEWRLAVRVAGERFLKIRSTLFNGEVSANLNLQGTLKEPIALGDVRVDSGLVRFPFASLQVQQGFVTLSSADPFRPQILLSAGSKYYGYETKMEVSGPVDAPVLQFTSIPPLSSEQIVLMLTAGELPRDVRAITMQQRAQTLAVFLGRDLLTRLGFGDESQQRLSIRSGEQLSEQGRPTYSVEYKLTDRWSLVGEYDRFNALNAGLKWRIFSR